MDINKPTNLTQSFIKAYRSVFNEFFLWGEFGIGEKSSSNSKLIMHENYIKN